MKWTEKNGVHEMTLSNEDIAKMRQGVLFPAKAKHQDLEIVKRA